MTTSSQDLFEVRPRHIMEGLTVSDCSTLAGQKITIVSLSTLPHWEKVERGVALADPEMKQRVEAIGHLLPRNAKKTRSSADPFSFLYKSKDGLSAEGVIAMSTTPIIDVTCKPIDNFPSIAEQLTDIKRTREKKTVFIDNKTQRQFVYPHSFSPDDITEITVPDSAILFDVPQTDSCKSIWGHLTNLPENFIARFPHDNTARVIAQLHEIRHASQLVWAARKRVTGFDKELDADLFALRSVAKCSQANETSQAWVHARYLNMLHCSDRYWFAPRLDPSFHEGDTLSRFQIQEAVGCVRRELYTSHLGSVRRSIFKTIPDIADSKYIDWMKANLLPNPAAHYSQLRKITEQGAFKKNPLANGIAHRILEAVEYFSPKISTIRANTLSCP